MAKQKPAVPGTRSDAPTDRADLERRRRGAIATGPSGSAYRVRPLNLQRHALAGGLPPTLRRAAMKGGDAVDEMFMSDELDTEVEGEEGGKATLLDYLDGLVLASVIEPALTKEDLGDPRDLQADPLLPPDDYRFLVQLAMRATDFDANGARVFGVEPITRWATFRHFHGCPEDCKKCAELTDALSEALA